MIQESCDLGERLLEYGARIIRFTLCALTCSSLSLAASSQVPSAQKPTPQDDRVLRAVVQLLAVGPADHEQNQECSATGFLINGDGYLITNAHVVEDAKRCLEKAPGAKILAKLAITSPRTAQAVPCEVVALDVPNDLSLLKIERPLLAIAGGKPPYATLDATPVQLGITVMVSGHPSFSWLPVTQSGAIVWLGRTQLEETDVNAMFSDAVEIDVHLRPGNSGSPVYRTGGGVIAVVDKRNKLRPAYSFAVAIHYAIELAEHHRVQWYAAE
jgi:serine protease Do